MRSDMFEHEVYSRYSFAPLGSGHGRSVCFLIGSTGISGGTFVILQHAQALQAAGWDVTLAALMIDHAGSPWHPALGSLRIVDLNDQVNGDFDLTIATWWKTIAYLPQVRSARFAYFVQSIESRFYLGDPWLESVVELAHSTYRMDIPVITIASWMQLCLMDLFGRPSLLVRNGIRKDVFNNWGLVVQPRPHEGLRVLIEGPVGVEMKNVDAAVRLARAGGASEVWLVSGIGSYESGNVDKRFSSLTIDEMASVYRSCDVLLKLSRVEGMFGPPLEMFHCGGTAITYDVTGYEEYLVSDWNSIVVRMDDEEAVIAAVRELAGDRSKLGALKHNALVTAGRWPDWESSSKEFVRAISALSRLEPRDNAILLGQASELRRRI